MQRCFILHRVTNNLERRLHKHNHDNATTAYTYKRRPVELVFAEPFQHILQAIEFEKKIKRWRREKKEAIILRNCDKLKQLSVCTNNTHSKFK